jgi:arsenate reductase-like glutaredoxin family protein
VEVQIFGRKKCADTRKTLRFFAERRVRTHFVDVDRKAPSRRELERFAQRFGPEEVIDRAAPRYTELGLHAAHLSATRILERAETEPRLLRTPLVRWKHHVLIGFDDEELRAWLAEAGS